MQSIRNKAPNMFSISNPYLYRPKPMTIHVLTPRIPADCLRFESHDRSFPGSGKTRMMRHSAFRRAKHRSTGQHLKPTAIGYLRRGGSRAGDGATDVEEVLDVVELDIETLNLPLAGVVGSGQDGNTADLGSSEAGRGDSEGSGPDERGRVAVPGAELVELEGEVVGLDGLLVMEYSKQRRRGSLPECAGGR